MLKKAIKTALAVILTTGLATSAMAEAMVNGNVRSYFGQYTPAGDDAVSRFVNKSEGNIGVKGTAGDVTGYMEVEVRDGGSATTEFNATKVWAQWNKDALSVKIGNDANGETLGMQGVGMTSNLASVGGAFADGNAGGYIEDDHLKIGYAVAGFNLGLSLFSYDTVSGISATQITVAGNAGPLAIKFANTAASSDNPDVTTDDDGENNRSNTHVGVMYPMGNMAISLDYSISTKKISSYTVGSTTFNFTDPVDDNFTYMRIGFSMTGAGPGALAFVYDTEAETVDGEDAGTTTWLNLGYDIPLGEGGGGIQIVYLTATKTFPSDWDIDAQTQSFIGAGLHAAF